MMNSQDKLKILDRFKEAQLIDSIILPLLEEMGFKNITKTHGQRERGLDLIFYRETEFNEREYTGVQVKADKIHGSSSKPGNATEILNQAQQAFKYSFPDVYDGTTKKIDKYIVMTSGEIINSARALIKDELDSGGYFKTIKFFDGKKLLKLIDEYMPSFFWEEYHYFSTYLKAMKTEFETIKDVSAIGQKEAVSLEKIYVSLRISQKLRPQVEERDSERIFEKEHIFKEKAFEDKHIFKERRKEQFNAENLTQKFRKAVIIGDPGSGKTTLLKHLTLQSCKKNLESQERVSLPIFITLRWYSESGKSIREYINDVFENYRFPEAKDFIEKDLKAGKCQLFFDGFDELASIEKQESVTKDIELFVKNYPKNQFMVTSRKAGYHGELGGFELLEIEPFNDHQISQFITNWFKKLNPEKGKLMEEAVKEHEKIRELARNPLMIAIIAIIYEEDQQLPQRRVKLYERCVEVLLSKWDVQRKIKNKYDPEAKQKILRKVALEGHEKEKRSFTKTELIERFSEYLPEVRIEKGKAEDVLNEIVKRNVLLQETSIGVYEFLHLSFQEYMAALELWEGKDYNTVLEYLYDPWWEEVVLLFAGFDRDATDLIKKIREKEETDEEFKEDIFCRNLMLMGKCIVDADYTGTEERNWICSTLWSLYQTAEFSSLRERAIRLLSFIKPGDILDSLVRDLEDENTNVRREAALALGEIGDERAVDSLIEALKDEDSEARGRATYALGKIGNERAVDSLIEKLKDENSGVRGRAALALGKIGNERAVDSLIEALKDENSEVRWKAAYALGKMGDEKTVNLLIEALQDEDTNVRGGAALALGKIGNERTVDSLIEALKDENSYVRREAALALGKIGNERTVDSLIEALKDEYTNVRREAALALGEIGDERTVDSLIEKLKDENSEVRGKAALALGKIGDERTVEKAVDSLIEKLKDENSNVRREAALALGKMGDERTVDSLIEKLKDEDSEVRGRAALALGEIGNERAVDSLIEALKDENSEVRWKAAYALGEIGNERTVDSLIEALKDEYIDVRWWAAYALGEIGNERAVDSLIEKLKDEDNEVRWRAAEALGKIGNERTVDSLIEALKDENSYVRWWAAYALGENRDERAVNPLIEALKDESEGIFGKVKDRAFNSLEKLIGKSQKKVF